MQQAEPETSRGAVATILVGTAPGGSQQTRDLLWHPVLGRPLVAWPLEALTRLDQLSSCLVVTTHARYADGARIIDERPMTQRGQMIASDRVPWFRALNALMDTMPGAWFVVVDAMLPLITTASLRAGLLAAARTGVAIAGEPVKETLKRVAGETVAETVPRERLRRLLPTLILQREVLTLLLERAREHDKAPADVVDFARWADAPLTVFDVDYPCVRVTTEHDLAIVESLLRQRESERSSP